MIRATRLAFGLLTLTPLAAQPFEVGLFLGRQRYNTFRRDAAPGLTVETDTGDKTFAALRLGYTLGSRGAYDFQATLGYQPETTARTEVKVSGASMGSGDLKHSAWMAGFGMNLRATLVYSLGLEYRHEKLSDGSTDATYGRPWIRGGMGYMLPASAVKPFLGLEVALPLATTNNDVASPEAILKSLAPSWQAGVYAGLRF